MTTLSSDLFIPEVLAGMVGPVIEKNLVMAQVANVDNTLQGQPGDEIVFRRWNYTGMADILTENVPMVPRKLGQTKTFGTIKEAGAAHEITDTAELTALGTPGSVAQTDLALSVADRLDYELRTAAEATETVDGKTYAPQTLGASTDPLSWLRLTRAFSKLGDKYDPRQLTLVIAPEQHIQLLQDESFIDASKFGGSSVLQTGQVGAIGSIPVVISGRATAAAGSVNALLIRRNSLTLFYKRRPVVERGRDILNRSDVITTNVHFGAKRTDDLGVVVIPTTADIG
jgi:N4-gp56 family major capsid protein